MLLFVTIDILGLRQPLLIVLIIIIFGNLRVIVIDLLLSMMDLRGLTILYLVLVAAVFHCVVCVSHGISRYIGTFCLFRSLSCLFPKCKVRLYLLLLQIILQFQWTFRSMFYFWHRSFLIQLQLLKFEIIGSSVILLLEVKIFVIRCSKSHWTVLIHQIIIMLFGIQCW